MVKYNPGPEEAFSALGDPIRLRVVARLSRGEESVSRLASGEGVSLPAFMKHLRLLERAGIISSRKAGRVRTCRLDVAALARTEAWLAQHRQFWEGQLDSLERYLSRPEPSPMPQTEVFE